MSVETRRSVALIGHSGVGKTPLCEAIFKAAGETTRIGKTTDGSSHFDFEPEEVKRDSTLKTSLFDFTYKNNSYALLDTPGSSSFLCDTACALRGADSALLIVGGSTGVKIQGKKAWKLAEAEGIARGWLVTDLDNEGASIETAVETAKNALGVNAAPIQIPLGDHTSFAGIADLVTMKAYLSADSDKTSDIPDEFKDAAESARTSLIERISETNDDLLEKYLEGQEFSEAEIVSGLKSAVAATTIFPLMCVAPNSGHGIIPLIKAFQDYFPSPVERTAYRVKEGDGEFEEIVPDASDDFIGVVYKTFADPFTGQVSLVRVISGTLNSDDTVYNVRSDSNERVGKLAQQRGKDHEQLTSAEPGDIAAITKLKHTITGDTLTIQSRPRQAESVQIPEGGMRFAVEPKSRGDEDKIFSALEKIHREDPSVVVSRESSTRETIVTCMGQQHMDITVERIHRKFNVEILLKTPKVPYRETIRGKAEAQGRHKKQSGGRGQFGDCWLRVNPRTRGEGFLFNNQIFGGSIPRNYIPAIEKGVMETMEKGFLAGFPLVDIECTVYDGSYHAVDSSDMAFKIAAAKGFKSAIEKAKPVLLEPIMTAEISVPDDATGDVIGDLNSRRGRVISMDPDGNMQIITAEVPLAEMLTYTPSLRSMTSDRGFFDLEFRGYEEVPPHAMDKVIQEYKSEQAEEEG